MQDEITEQVVATIAGSGVISRARFAEIKDKPSDGLDAYDRHELDGFFAEMERAIALDPNDANILATIGDDLFLAGDPRGMPPGAEAAKLDPLHPTWYCIPIRIRRYVAAQRGVFLTSGRRRS